MDARTAADSLLAELAGLISLPTLALDEYGSCHLSFDEQTVVSFSIDEKTDDMVLASPVGIAAADDTRLLAELLDANFAGRATRGAVLGVDSGTRGVVLSLRLPVAGLRVATLERRLQDFVTTAEEWTARIALPADARRRGDDTRVEMPMGAIRV